MAVDFLTDEQKAHYGQYVGEPDEFQLARYFHLDKTDLAFIVDRRGDQNRLGSALQLTSVRFLGTFLTDLSLVPINAQIFVAGQLSLTDITVLNDYGKRETTKREHTALIREHYGYRDFNEVPWVFRLSRLLYAKSWISNERPSLMFDFATTWLIQHKIILPGESTLSRLISEIRERAARRLWNRLSSLPTPEQKGELDSLLQIPKGERTSRFDYYRKGPVTISAPAFNEAMKRYLELQAFGFGSFDCSHIPPVRLKNLARYAGIISAKKIARMPDDKRAAILVAFVRTLEIIALDDALDLLDLLTTGISSDAKKIGQKKRLRTLKDLDKAALSLAKACEQVLNEGTTNTRLREAIYTLIPKEKLLESIEIVNNLARPMGDKFHDEIVEQYGRVRRFLPCALKDIVFKAAPAGKNTLEALEYLARVNISRTKILKNPPLHIITQPWKRLVFDKEGNVLKQGYTLCLLDKLQDSLKRRDIYVENSDRWGDTRTKLLQGIDWHNNRIQICRLLGHSLAPHDAIVAMTNRLDATYKKVAANFDNNNAIRIDHSGKHPTVTITNLDKLETPSTLTFLSEQISGLLPRVDLTELILEIHARTGFLDEFTHVSESTARADDLPISLCAVLLAEACNIGLEPLIKHHIPALTRHRLSWVKQNYIRAETLARANARLVDYQSTIPLAKKWGGGDVASADGMRFVTSVRTINAGPNRKYFGSNKGITWYNFISDQFSGFHGIVVPGTLRDSIFILEGLLEQQTGLNPTEIMTDTAGASDIIFGLFWLLGYQFSPRLGPPLRSVLPTATLK